MCGFAFVFGVFAALACTSTGKSPRWEMMCKRLRNIVQSRLPTGNENRFENNQNKKHYHFTIRRTQTRCLMNHITISSDISPYLYCGKESEREENPRYSESGEMEEKRKRKVILQQQDFSISHETSNFVYKMKSFWKYEKYDKQIGIFMYFTRRLYNKKILGKMIITFTFFLPLRRLPSTQRHPHHIILFHDFQFRSSVMLL